MKLEEAEKIANYVLTFATQDEYISSDTVAKVIFKELQSMLPQFKWDYKKAYVKNPYSDNPEIVEATVVVSIM